MNIQEQEQVEHELSRDHITERFAGSVETERYEYPITRERHAAHTGDGTGWDLERIDAVADRREDVRDIPRGFTYHSGYRGRSGDGVGYQVWIYYRKAPLSPGTCERCEARS